MKSESAIQRECLKYFALLPNCYAFRSSAGAIKTQKGYFKTGRVGLPDITAIITGIPYFFEVKNEKGKQSKGQQQAEIDITNAGGRYFIVRSVGELHDLLSRKEE